jgi:hypothetical protein
MDVENKDKSAFVVALLAAVLAFSSFKDELSNITISLGFYQTSFLLIIIIFFVILTLSTYLYALDYIRYGTKIQNSIIFKWILPFANFLYLLALLFPLVIFLIWVANVVIQSINLSTMSTDIILTLSSTISVLIGSIVSLVSSKTLTKNIRYQLAEKLEEEGESRFQKAHQLYKNRFYAETILELFKVVESNIRKKLEEIGIVTKNFSPTVLKIFAKKEKILSSQNLAHLDDLRVMRNNAAHHKRISFTRENADSAFKIVEDILKEIDKN